MPRGVYDSLSLWDQKAILAEVKRIRSRRFPVPDDDELRPLEQLEAILTEKIKQRELGETLMQFLPDSASAEVRES